MLLLAFLLCQLPTANLPASSCSWLLCCTAPFKGLLAGLKHHGSEGRSGPAAGSPDCQTSLSELPKLASNLAFTCLPALPTANQLACVVLQLAFVLHGSGQGTPSQGSNTMAVKDGAGPWPAAQTAKRRFLNWLETSFKPCFYVPSCSANCQLACVVLQLAFVLRGSGQGTPSQGSNTMAVKDGAGPRPAAKTAKRHFLNCLETSFKPCFYVPSCQLPTCLRRLAAGFCAARLRSRDPLRGLKHHGSEGRSGPAAGSPDCQTSLSELPRNYLQTLLLLALLLCQLPTCLRRLAAAFCAARLRSKDPPRRAQTPWQ